MNMINPAEFQVELVFLRVNLLPTRLTSWGMLPRQQTQIRRKSGFISAWTYSR